TVCGRNALRISGRSKATRTAPVSTARWYVMSVKSKPGSSFQADGSKISETLSRMGTMIAVSVTVRGMLSVFGVSGLPEIEPGADLAAMIVEHVTPSNPLADGDIVVVTSKIVSKAEGRTVELH